MRYELQVMVPQLHRGEPQAQTIASFHSAQQRTAHMEKYPRTTYQLADVDERMKKLQSARQPRYHVEELND